MATAAGQPTRDSMLQDLEDMWWLPLLWGIAALITGILILAKPSISAVVLVSVVAVFWLVGGVFDLIGGIVHGDAPGRVWRIVGGVIGILAGLAVLMNPILGTLVALSVLYYYVAFSALINGVINLYVGIRVRTDAGASRSWGNFLLGLVQIFLGILLLLHPLSVGTLLAVVYAIGIVAIAGGVFSIFLAVRVRSLAEDALRTSTA